MAHLIPDDAFVPGWESHPIKTEAGSVLKNYTMEDVSFCLHLLAYNNSNFQGTAGQLQTIYGIRVNHITLRNWVVNLFPQKYVEIQTQLEKQINEKLTTQTVDVAAKALEAQDKALDRGLETMDTLRPSAISTAAKNYSDVASKNLLNSQLLRDKPTSIVKHQTPDDAIRVLQELGLEVDAEEAEELTDPSVE